MCCWHEPAASFRPSQQQSITTNYSVLVIVCADVASRCCLWRVNIDVCFILLSLMVSRLMSWPGCRRDCCNDVPAQVVRGY